MGAHPYWYFVKYNENTNEALLELREREFRAGRYNPATWMLEFPVPQDSTGVGAQHQSIDEAIEEAAEEGTRSILDIEKISEEPDYCAAAPFDPELLESLYGTTKPSRDMLEQNMDFLDDIERGQCLYTIVYKNGKPDEIFFAGYSFD